MADQVSREGSALAPLVPDSPGSDSEAEALLVTVKRNGASSSDGEEEKEFDGDLVTPKKRTLPTGPIIASTPQAPRQRTGEPMDHLAHDLSSTALCDAISEIENEDLVTTTISAVSGDFVAGSLSLSRHEHQEEQEEQPATLVPESPSRSEGRVSAGSRTPESARRVPASDGSGAQSTSEWSGSEFGVRGASPLKKMVDEVLMAAIERREKDLMTDDTRGTLPWPESDAEQRPLVLPPNGSQTPSDKGSETDEPDGSRPPPPAEVVMEQFMREERPQALGEQELDDIFRPAAMQPTGQDVALEGRWTPDDELEDEEKQECSPPRNASVVLPEYVIKGSDDSERDEGATDGGLTDEGVTDGAGATSEAPTEDEMRNSLVSVSSLEEKSSSVCTSRSDQPRSGDDGASGTSRVSTDTSGDRRDGRVVRGSGSSDTSGSTREGEARDEGRDFSGGFQYQPPFPAVTRDVLDEMGELVVRAGVEDYMTASDRERLLKSFDGRSPNERTPRREGERSSEDVSEASTLYGEFPPHVTRELHQDLVSATVPPSAGPEDQFVDPRGGVEQQSLSNRSNDQYLRTMADLDAVERNLTRKVQLVHSSDTSGGSGSYSYRAVTPSNAGETRHAVMAEAQASPGSARSTSTGVTEEVDNRHEISDMSRGQRSMAWDHGADLNADDSGGRFIPGLRQGRVEPEGQPGAKQQQPGVGAGVKINAMLTSGLVPVDLALDLLDSRQGSLSGSTGEGRVSGGSAGKAAVETEEGASGGGGEEGGELEEQPLDDTAEMLASQPAVVRDDEVTVLPPSDEVETSLHASHLGGGQHHDRSTTSTINTRELLGGSLGGSVGQGTSLPGRQDPAYHQPDSHLSDPLPGPFRSYVSDQMSPRGGVSGGDEGLAARVRMLLEKESPHKMAHQLLYDVEALERSAKAEGKMRSLNSTASGAVDQTSLPYSDLASASQVGEQYFTPAHAAAFRQAGGGGSGASSLSSSLRRVMGTPLSQMQPFSAFTRAEDFLQQQLRKMQQLRIDMSRTPYSERAPSPQDPGRHEEERGVGFSQRDLDLYRTMQLSRRQAPDDSWRASGVIRRLNTTSPTPGDKSGTADLEYITPPRQRAVGPVRPVTAPSGPSEGRGSQALVREVEGPADTGTYEAGYPQPVAGVGRAEVSGGHRSSEASGLSGRHSPLGARSTSSDSRQLAPGDVSTTPPSSGSGTRRRLVPYRPGGQGPVYYVNTTQEDSNITTTATLESTHTGSDDARSPHFPSGVLGSREVSLANASPGIYARSSAGPPALAQQLHRQQQQQNGSPDKRVRINSDVETLGTPRTGEDASQEQPRSFQPRQWMLVEEGAPARKAQLASVPPPAPEEAHQRKGEERRMTPDEAREGQEDRESGSGTLPQLLQGSEEGGHLSERVRRLREMLEHEEQRSGVGGPEIHQLWQRFMQQGGARGSQEMRQLASVLRDPGTALSQHAAQQVIRDRSPRRHSPKRDKARQAKAAAASKPPTSPRQAHKSPPRQDATSSRAEVSSPGSSNAGDTTAKDTSSETTGMRRPKLRANRVGGSEGPNEEPQAASNAGKDDAYTKLLLKIEKQRVKADKERRREEKRRQKIERLEQLLAAHSRGEVTGIALSAAAQSGLASESEDTLANMTAGLDTTYDATDFASLNASTLPEVEPSADQTPETWEVSPPRRAARPRTAPPPRHDKSEKDKRNDKRRRVLSDVTLTDTDTSTLTADSYPAASHPTRVVKITKKVYYSKDGKRVVSRYKQAAEKTGREQKRPASAGPSAPAGEQDKGRSRDVGQTFPTPLKDKHFINEAIQTSFASPARPQQPTIAEPVLAPRDKNAAGMFTPDPSSDGETASYTSAGEEQEVLPPAVSWFVPTVEAAPWRRPGQPSGELAGLLDQAEELGDTHLQDRIRRLIQQGESMPRHLQERKPVLEKEQLQTAFADHMGDFISRSRERQRRVALAAEERRMGEFLAHERHRLFACEQRRRSDGRREEQVYQPRKRPPVSLPEARMKAAEKYKDLPEVKAKTVEKRKEEFRKTNRLRAQLYKQKVLTKVLNKRGPWANPI